MAFSFNSGGGGKRRRRFSALPALSEINVVPLVDVVLVLLIIFMLTANVMEFGLNIHVPQVKMVRKTAKDLPVVSITKSGASYLNENPVNIHVLAQTIRQKFHGATAVYVRADKQTPWDPIAQVVAELGEAKFDVKMVTEPINSAARHQRRRP